MVPTQQACVLFNKSHRGPEQTDSLVKVIIQRLHPGNQIERKSALESQQGD